MANGASPTRAPWAFLIISLIVHYLDALWRYGTSAGTHWDLWAGAFAVYFLIGWYAMTQPAFDHINKKGIFVITAFAYVWGPLWSALPSFFPGFSAYAALFLVVAPVWPAVTLLTARAEGKMFRFVSACYVTLWIILLLFSLQPQIQEYASQQSDILPGSLTPAQALTYALSSTVEATTGFFKVMFIQAPSRMIDEAKRSWAAATGDYYTGQVDAAAQKRLGVYLGQLRPSESVFYANTPVSVYTTITAETLDKPLTIRVSCDATPQTLPVIILGTTIDVPTIPVVLETEPVPATTIRPQDTFEVITADQFDVDCIWSKDKLRPAPYTIKLKTDFDFSTRAYKKLYMISRDRLREYRRQNVDPLAQVPDRNAPAIYTSGPLRVGIGTQQEQQPNALVQPIAIGERNEPLPTWGITLQNAWEGKVLEITDVFIFIPEGITVVDPEGAKAWAKADCKALTEEEQVACDDALVDVYRLTQEELALSWYRNLTTKTIRVHVEASDPEKILGRAPLAVQNFKANVHYRYGLERSLTVSVRNATTT